MVLNELIVFLLCMVITYSPCSLYSRPDIINVLLRGKVAVLPWISGTKIQIIHTAKFKCGFFWQAQFGVALYKFGEFMQAM